MMNAVISNLQRASPAMRDPLLRWLNLLGSILEVYRNSMRVIVVVVGLDNAFQFRQSGRSMKVGNVERFKLDNISVC